MSSVPVVIDIQSIVNQLKAAQQTLREIDVQLTNAESYFLLNRSFTTEFTPLLNPATGTIPTKLTEYQNLLKFILNNPTFKNSSEIIPEATTVYSMGANITKRYEKLKEDYLQSQQSIPTTLPISSTISPLQTCTITELPPESHTTSLVSIDAPVTQNSFIHISTPQYSSPRVPKAANSFDVADKYYFDNLRTNVENGEYKTSTERVDAVKRVVKLDQSLNHYVFEDSVVKGPSVNILSRTEGKTRLSSIIPQGCRKNASMFHHIEGKLSDLMVKDVKFFSLDPQVFSLFYGYRHKILPKASPQLPYLFFKLMFEIICNGRQKVFDYIVNWIAYIVQNPGKLVKTALVLKGLPKLNNRTLPFFS